MNYMKLEKVNNRKIDEVYDNRSSIITTLYIKNCIYNIYTVN
jgi:hypothetical protein